MDYRIYSVNDFINNDVLKFYRHSIYNPFTHTTTIIRDSTEWYSIPCSFDIETTTIDRQSYMYIWTMGIDSYIIRGRTWEEFKRLLTYISDALGLWDKCRIICGVHNLSYEFQFFKHQLEWNTSKDGNADIFAMSNRKIVKACTSEYIEFRCTSLLSGYSLKDLAKNYTKTQKMVGDLDYNIIRNSQTPLSDTEYKYTDNDVIIIMEYLEYLYRSYSPEKLPLTKTAFVRKDLKQSFKSADVEYKKQYKAFIINSFPKEKEYKMWMKWLFKGGYVHANYIDVGHTITEKMGSWDFKSAYPSACFDTFPNKFISIKGDKENIEKVLENIEKYAFIIDVTFFDVRSKNVHHIYSKHKCLPDSENILCDNGRVISADVMHICLNEYDYLDFIAFYEHDAERMKINKMWVSKKTALPPFFLDLVYQYFQIKETTPKHTIEYRENKARLNSLYGMCVTGLYNDNLIYNTDNGTFNVGNDKEDFRTIIQKQILLPQWGIWISAITRHNLLSTIAKVGEDATYSDTDSAKVQNPDINAHFFNEFNEKMRERNEKIRIHLGYELKNLGFFEFEGYYTKFKTLGCKRYIYEDEKGFHSTIAGLPVNSYKQFCDAHNLDYFATFRNDLEISENETEKHTTAYTDEPYSTHVMDDYGNSEVMHEKSGVAIVRVPFSLNMEKEFMNYLMEYKARVLEKNRIIIGERL